MIIVSSDACVIMLRGFDPQGQREIHCGVLQRLKGDIWQKGTDLWNAKKWILHDNYAPYHRALFILVVFISWYIIFLFFNQFRTLRHRVASYSTYITIWFPTLNNHFELLSPRIFRRGPFQCLRKLKLDPVPPIVQLVCLSN